MQPKTKLALGGVLCVWAAGLQLHLWRLQQDPAFKEKFDIVGTEPESPTKVWWQWWSSDRSRD